MKNLLLVLFAMFSGMAIYAQSLEIHYEGENIPNGSAITYTGDVSLLEIVGEVEVKNVAGDSVAVKVKKYDVNLLPNTATMMCWVYCFAPNIYVSPTTLKIGPGQTVEEFAAHYQPGGVSGVSTVMFTFYDEINENDSISFNAEFNAGTVGFEELDKETAFVSAPYPNPAINQVSFDYQLENPGDAEVVVMNMLGSVVKKIRLNSFSGTETISVSDLKEGVYFYSVILDKQVLETKKLVVSR